MSSTNEVYLATRKLARKSSWVTSSPKLYRVTISAVTGIGWECDHLYHLSCKKAVYGTKNECSHSLVGVYQTSRRSFGPMRVVYRPIHVLLKRILEIADPARSALGRLLRLQCNMIMLASVLWCSVRLRSIFCD